MKHPFRAALALALLLATSACSSTVRYALLGGREHATTEGEARFEERDEGGYDVDLSLDRLPSAERLDLEHVHYVVWMRRHGSTDSTRIAVLAIDPTTRTGHAVAVVPSRRIELLVTAESSEDVTAPTGAVLVHSVLEADD